MNWLPYKGDDLLKIIDIDASPEVNENFKVLLLAMARQEGNPYLTKQGQPRLEIIASPYSIAESFEALEDDKMQTLFAKKIESLKGFCEANNINYIRFSLEV